MKMPSKKTILNTQKTLVGFCALALLTTLSTAAIGQYQHNPEVKIAGLVGSIIASAGLGMTLGGYLSNPYRYTQKKQRG